MADYILPNVGQRVRLRDGQGAFDTVVPVLSSDGDAVVVETDRVVPEAHLIFSSRVGPIRLTGPLFADPLGALLRVTAEKRTQRRAAFRIGLGVPAIVKRHNGARLTCTVIDLSITGALLGRDAIQLGMEERVVVHIQSAGLDKLAMSGRVVRIDGRNRGIAFDPLAKKDDAKLQKVIVAHQRDRI